MFLKSLLMGGELFKPLYYVSSFLLSFYGRPEKETSQNYTLVKETSKFVWNIWLAPFVILAVSIDL